MVKTKESKMNVLHETIRYMLYDAPVIKHEEEVVKSLDSAICNRFEISQDQLYSHGRKKEVVNARRLYFWILMSMNINPVKIAELTGFDRTTVYFHGKRAPDYIKTEKDYREKAESIMRGVQNHTILIPA